MTTAKEIALICAAGAAFSGALLLAWFAYRQFMRARQACLEQAEAEPWQPGDHEFCDLTDEEQGWFDYFANRYRGLGEGVTR